MKTKRDVGFQKRILTGGCVGANWPGLGRQVAVILVGLILSGWAATAADASPWWWAIFSKGDGGSLSSGSSIEDYIAQFMYSSQTSDTVYMASFTWGTGTNEPVNGTWGINSVANARAGVSGRAPCRVIADGDDAGTISGQINSNVSLISSPSSGSATHNKIITLGRRGVMTGSTNFTSGGYSNQPNNMVILWVPTVAQAYLTELDDQFLNNNFVENSPSPQNLFSSPAGDRIEVFFAPDDNGNISISPYSAGSALKDVLKYRIANANESVFYMINQFGMTTELSSSLTSASSSSVLVEGWIDVDVADNLGTLQGDHTCRNWAAFSSVQGHHKVMIFDMDIVATGSANHTYGSMRNSSGSANVENLVLIHDFRLARKYMREYRRSMAQLSADNTGAADGFEQTAPGAVTGLSASDVSGTSNQLQVSWTAPAGTDLSRYYIFISPTAITTQKDIGDGIDDDNDGYYDEDPVGNVDGFSSGSSMLTANNDDADGSTDEDPWMFPEARVKSQTAGASLNATLSTVNVGDQLQDNTNYWIAVVAVDKHGNEGPLSVVGPVQSLPATPGAIPAASVAFAAGASNVVSVASTLTVSVGNAASAAQSIAQFTVDLGSASNAEIASSTPTAPTGWTASKSGNTVTFGASSAVYRIDAGETQTFDISVVNASSAGAAANLTVSTTDALGAQITGLDAGYVTLVPAQTGGTTNSIMSISATDGANSATAFTGLEKLLQTNITVDYAVANTPNTGTFIWWDVNKDPDGPGGSSTDRPVAGSGATRSFSATIPGSTDSAVVHGAEIRFLIQVDNETHTSGGSYYKFVIDDSVTLPGGLAVTSLGFNTLTVGWNAISDADFQQYEIYYSTTSPATLTSPYITVSSRTTTSAQITGLAINTTYYIAILARDVYGNVSGLSSSISGATKKGTNVTVSNASDGTTQIGTSQLDGTGILSDNAITISFTLDSGQSSPNVQVYYDVGDNPDGAGGTNTQDRQVVASGSGTNWQAVIPGVDGEIVDGVTVKFVFYVAGQVIQNSGSPYRFKVVRTITQAPGNFAIADTTGVGFTLTWTQLSVPSNFGCYRIYYATDTVTTASNTWDRDEDVALYFTNAGRTTITSMTPGTQYRMKIAGVDALGNVGPLSSEVVGRTTSKGSVLITEVAPEGQEFVEIEALTGPVDISTFSLNDNDSPGPAVPLGGGQGSITLSAGQRAVIRLGVAGATEFDTGGDADNSGARDIYYNYGAVALLNDGDQIILNDSAGDTINAVVYITHPSDAYPIVYPDVIGLVPSFWKSADTFDAVFTYSQLTTDHPASFARKRDAYGKLLNTNTKNDWELIVDTTPGGVNRFLAVSGLQVSDTSTFSVSTATRLDGTERLKGGPYRVKFDFNQHPLLFDSIMFWYDTGADPDGRNTSNSNDARKAIATHSPGSLEVDSDVTIVEAQHGREIRFILTSENRSTTVSDTDEIRFRRQDAFSYVFRVDRVGPDTPAGLRVIDRTVGGFKLTWSPIGNASGDFSKYVLFYDTGCVTSSSSQWTSANDPLLSNHQTSATTVTGLLSNTYYYFRLASVDDIGNLSGMSDTAAETSVAPVHVNTVTVSDGANTIVDFSGSARLKQTEQRVTVTFDRSVASPVLYWNTIPSAPADGPGGNSDSTTALTVVTSNQYTCTLPVFANDSTVFFVFNTDAGVIQNVASAFSYKVDGQAGDTLGSFRFGGYFDVGPNRNTSVAVTWTPLSSASYTDFEEYRIYYKQGANVTTSTGSIWGRSKVPVMADIRASGTAVQGLAANDTYTFMVVWVDRVGNMSGVSDTFSVTTINATPYSDPATDGVNTAHLLDGTEWLMKTNITVTFQFTTSPRDPSTAILKWNVGGSAGEGQSRTISMSPRSWDPLVYDGVIPGATDGLVSDGCMVQYVLWADGIKFDNYGVDFKFKVDATPPEPLTGVNVVDNGSSLTAIWTPTAMSDFQTYRIRYRQSTVGSWTILDKSNKTILGNKSASNLTFNVSSTGHYYVNIATVDWAGHEAWQPADRVIKRGAAVDPVLTVQGERLVPVVAGRSAMLTVKLWDMNGTGWSGQTVNFNLAADTGGLGVLGATAKSVVTGADGTASVTLWPTGSNRDYRVTATSAAAPGSAPWFHLRALPDERLRDQTQIYYFEYPSQP